MHSDCIDNFGEITGSRATQIAAVTAPSQAAISLHDYLLLKCI